MARILLLALLMAAPLAAQDNEPLSGSVPSNRRLTYLFEIDFGPNATAWTLACSLTTNSAAGLVVTLIDIDGLASSALAQPDSVNVASINSSGTANASLSGSYSGVREFAVEVETASSISASDFNGSLVSNAGMISFVRQDQLIYGAPGLKTAVRRFAFWDGSVPAGSTVPVSLELDFGPVQRTLFVRFEGAGTGLDRMELVDRTNDDSVVLATFTNLSAGQVTAVPLTHSGKVFLRVNTRALASRSGSGAWSITVPTGIDLRRVGTEQKKSSEEGCSLSHTTGRSWLLLVAVVLGWWLVARYRRLTTDHCP
jgi:hypothetical protein